MGAFREKVVRADWLERGYELTSQQVHTVDLFFDAWFDIYNLPNVTAFRSREALTAIYEGGLLLFGDRLTAREQKNAASVLRAGYVVAATEAKLGYRTEKDPNLVQLFELMERDDPSGQLEPLAVAHWRGRQLADVTNRACVDAEVAERLPGFQHREAIFSDIGRLLFTKLRITSWPKAKLDREHADLAMRFGHVVGVCEESLPTTLSVTAA